ncbi:hypothetical protein ACXR0O_10280 [Verrucomicrobiota bacterium sgz303538]
MKTSSLTSLLAAAALWLGSAVISQAQEPVSTGTIQGLVPWAGTLTLRSDQTHGPMTFWGIDRANIFSADGQPAGIGDLQPGMNVTVQYAVRGRKWYISKVMLSEQRSAPIVSVPLYSVPALTSRAANDNDITTQPANNAAYDNDITTQPGSYNNYNTRIPVRRRNP